MSYDSLDLGHCDLGFVGLDSSGLVNIIAAYFSHSVITSQELEKCQAEMKKDVQPVKVIQCVEDPAEFNV